MKKSDAAGRPTRTQPRRRRVTRLQGHRRRGAFTLIELLVVIGLVALLVGGLGFSLSDTTGRRLATAQQTLAAMCGNARAHAALHQTEVRLVICADLASSDHLRVLQLSRAEPPGSSRWVAVGAAASLPHGIAVVPPDVSSLLADGVLWPGSPPLTSTLRTGDTNESPHGAAFLYLSFGEDGAPELTGSDSHARLIVGTVRRDGAQLRFNNPAALRGVIIRGNGALSFVNDAHGW